MSRDEFWALIDATRAASGGESDSHERALVEALAQRTPAEIVEFDRHARELLAESYQDRLWGAAYLINGGCSDDGFDYFRGWLIAQGRRVYEAALAEPDSLAECEAIGDGDVEFEALWYVADRAYEQVTGESIEGPSSGVMMVRSGDGAVDFEFEDRAAMRAHYPRL